MFENKEFDAFFAQAVTTLKSYLNDLVCIGGCASALYRHHPLASSIQSSYLGTKDIDWSAPHNLPQGNRKLITDLMTESDFKEVKLGNNMNPVIKYVSQNGKLAADIEFLCPESGCPGGRNKESPPPSLTIQPGLLAQPLRYMEILQHRPWKIDLGSISEFNTLQGIHIRTPNPAAYVVQKVLIRDQRRSEPSAAKDCYYIYEISIIFRDSLDAIAKETTELKSRYSSWMKKFPKIAETLFADKNAAGPVSAIKVYNESLVRSGTKSVGITEEMIYRSVSKLLAAMK